MSDDNPFAPSEPVELPTEALELAAPQTVRIKLRTRDLDAAFDYLLGSAPEWRQKLAGNRRELWAAAVALAVIGGLVAVAIPDLIAVGATMAGTAIFVMLGSLLRVPARRMYLRQSIEAAFYQRYAVAEQGELIVTLSQTSVRVKASNRGVEHYWRGVRSVDQNASHLFLGTTDGLTIPLPADAFNSPAEFDGWADLATRLWIEHHPDQVASTGGAAE
ncbi:MAG: hypothetical protein AAGJ46_19730 [Planctomycetota bacterium]